MTECKHCGLIHGVLCPSVKAIEYFPDGTVKRVEYMTPADCPQTLSDWINRAPNAAPPRHPATVWHGEIGYVAPHNS